MLIQDLWRTHVWKEYKENLLDSDRTIVFFPLDLSGNASASHMYNDLNLVERNIAKNISWASSWPWPTEWCQGSDFLAILSKMTTAYYCHRRESGK